MITILGMLGALQGFILAGAVLSRGGSKRSPNLYLGSVLLILSIAVATISGQHGNLFGGSIYPILLEYTASFLFPPVFWSYATTVLGFRPKIPLWIHFLPVTAWILYLLAFTVGWTSWRWLPPILMVIGYAALYTGAIALRAWSTESEQRALVSHHRVLRALVLILVAVHLAQVIRFLFQSVSMLDDVVPLTATAMLCIFSLLAFRQSRFFVDDEPPSNAEKYASSTLTSGRAEEIRALLVKTMEGDRPFLNENLNLADMAARLKVSRSHLSQVVNDEMGCNFSDLLAQYRVQEADRLLADLGSRHLTVEDVAYAVGFRSRSAFHSAFKRIRDETPGQARRRLSRKTFDDTSRETEG